MGLGTTEAERGFAATPGAEFKPLFDTVEELIKRLADAENGEIKRIRAKVHEGLLRAQSMFHERTAEGKRQALAAANASELPTDGGSWQAAGAAALAAIAIGLLFLGSDAD
jgi:ElaB/YqjD/DUF883 family membrane-anchored ribosome-binding protein